MGKYDAKYGYHIGNFRSRLFPFYPIFMGIGDSKDVAQFGGGGIVKFAMR